MVVMSKYVAVFIGCLVQVLLSNDVFVGQEAKETDLKEVATAKEKSEFKAKVLAASTIVFLGDSNTNAGGYLNNFETALMLQRPAAKAGEKIRVAEIINLGLPSETCSGDSEPIHPFPRPNVHERLVRALERSKPDLAFSCYGMNDGIYHPFSEERFESFKEGTLKLIKAHADAGVPLILLTPPPFDPLPGRKAGKLVGKDAKEFSWKNIYENYDPEVIEVYAKWMMTLDEPNSLVIDVHGPIKKYIEERRTDDPNFAFSHDGVHFDLVGHCVLGNVILTSLGFEPFKSEFAKLHHKKAQEQVKKGLSKQDSLLQLVRQRHAISHPAWLTEVEHVRPNVKPGLPMDQAIEKMKPISDEVSALLKQ